MKKIILLSITIITLSSLFFASCVRKKFDAPPDTSSYDPNLTVTKTIWQLKQMYNLNAGPSLITDDITIAGIVVADDRSGAFYKQIIVQDSTSGITVLLNRSGLYADYPIGRKIYIKCKGLYLGSYGNFIQLGAQPDITNFLSNIPAANFSDYIVKASYPHAVVPMKVSISQIYYTNNTPPTAQQRQWMGTLIQLDSVEFIQSEVGSAYAQDPNISSGTDTHIEDCAGNTVVLRTSGYANYWAVQKPAGKGPLVGIYSTFETSTKKTPQILIRDTTDVNFTATRCGGVVILPAVDITIDSLRHLFVGSDTNNKVILGNYKIHGVITSNLKDSNISKYNAIIEDESGKGIVLYYGSASYPYKQGDSITVDVSSGTLSYYRGSLEVTASMSKTTVNAPGKSVTPKPVTIANLISDFSNLNYGQRQYESVLVKITGCTIAGTPTTYSGSKTVTDGTGNITLYTSTSASFAGASCPATPVSITAISTVYGKYFSQCVNQIQIRNTSDVQ